ncbi:sigma-70 family RNA polymerase sigma factor [uncultured Microbulbifer sp.]|uniref:RNA polymerase sigma factor n=1 Tax=uncultured Microbulbifer sp. TaxID=348147 RepID=UPI0026331449|nr:sigma-70 family RNA polymerase sigma factor [uncultured Microbulbifer sp.]
MFADKLCSLSDEDLVAQYYDTRNHKVFQEIYQRYKDELFRYCAQMTPQRCIPLMESLWAKFLDAPPKLHQHCLKNWLYLQVNKQLRTVDTTEVITGSDDADLAKALEKSAVLRAIQQLPLRQRNIFLLFTECGLSLATAADIERIPLAVCRNLLQQSREHIEQAIHGTARKPWKSTATLAHEAAAQAKEAEAAGKAGDAQPAPSKARPIFPWEKSPNPAAATSATANRSVEVA